MAISGNLYKTPVHSRVFQGVDVIPKGYVQREIARITLGNNPIRGDYEQESRRINEELSKSYKGSFTAQVVEGETGLHIGIHAADRVIELLKFYVSKRLSNHHPPELKVYPPADESQLGRAVNELSDQVSALQSANANLKERNMRLADQYEEARKRVISSGEEGKTLQQKVGDLEAYARELEKRPQKYSGFSFSSSSGTLAEALARNTQGYLENQEETIIAMLCETALALEQRVVIGNDSLDVMGARKVIAGRDQYLNQGGRESFDLLPERNRRSIQREWDTAAKKIGTYGAKNAESLELVVWLARSGKDAIVALPCVSQSKAPVPTAFYSMLEEITSAHTAKFPEAKGEIGSNYQVHVLTLKLTGVSDYEQFKQEVISRIGPLAGKINARVSYLGSEYFPDISVYGVTSKDAAQTAQNPAREKTVRHHSKNPFMSKVRSRVGELGYTSLSSFCRSSEKCKALRVVSQFFNNHAHDNPPTTATIEKMATVLDMPVGDVKKMFSP